MFYVRVPWPTMLAWSRATAAPERFGDGVDGAVVAELVRAAPGVAVVAEQARVDADAAVAWSAAAAARPGKATAHGSSDGLP